MDLKKKVAVLVLNYNGKEFLEKCFDSLEKQTTKDYDVFLIDNNSNDNSVEFTKKIFDWVNIIKCPKNLGFTGAYNFTFKFLENYQKNYDFYLLINNDTISDKRLIEETIDIFGQSEEIGVVVPTIVTENFLIDSCGGRFFFLTGTPFGYLHNKKYTRKDIKFRCFWGSGCAFAIRKELLRKIGYFENYFIYFEDVDLSWRVNNLNHKVISTLNTHIIHLGSKTMKSSPFSHYLCERNRISNYWQNLSLPLFLGILPIFLTGRILLLFKSSSFQEAAAKIKGIIIGLVILARHKRRNYSFRQDLVTIRNMHKIKKIRFNKTN